MQQIVSCQICSSSLAFFCIYNLHTRHMPILLCCQGLTVSMCTKSYRQVSTSSHSSWCTCSLHHDRQMVEIYWVALSHTVPVTTAVDVDVVVVDVSQDCWCCRLCHPRHASNWGAMSVHLSQFEPKNGVVQLAPLPQLLPLQHQLCLRVHWPPSGAGATHLPQLQGRWPNWQVSVTDNNLGCMTQWVSVTDNNLGCMTQWVSVTDNNLGCMTQWVSVTDNNLGCMTQWANECHR